MTPSPALGALDGEANESDGFTLELGARRALVEGPVAPDIPPFGGSAVDLVEALTTRTALPATAPDGWLRLHDGLRRTWDLPRVAAQHV